MSTLDNLRTEAKRWLKALRANDAEARARLLRAHPKAPAAPGLRDIQHALALERGAKNWQELKASSEAAAQVDSAGRDWAASFLQYACWDNDVHGRGDYARNEHAAMRILQRHPELARDSIYTAVVCGELALLRRLLSQRPAAARESGGPRGWPPLLYLCYARLPLPAAIANSGAMARRLLEHGADPNAYYMACESRYTALVGVAGEGEQDATRHPQAGVLYRLLLEHGAGPYDIQVLYNTHFRGDVLWWLEMTYEQAVRLGRESDWRNADWPMFDMGPYGSGARFFLSIALKTRNLELAEWLLAHGANPNAAPARDWRASKRSLYEEALLQNFPEMAGLLLRHGAAPVPLVLNTSEAFTAACLRLDRREASNLLEQHPDLLERPDAIFAAVRHDRTDAVALLLDLGVSTEIEDRQKQRPLHIAVAENTLRTAAFLIQRGAQVDPRESNWNATPMGYARYAHKQAMLDLLAPHSRDVWALTVSGKVERLRELLGEDASLAKVSMENGFTPLCWLPDDEAIALRIIDLFLAYGADPSLASSDGKTAADYARRRGMDAAAHRLSADRPAPAKPPANPAFAIVAADCKVRPTRALEAADWDALLDAVKEERLTALEAGGQMTDAVLQRVAALDHLTHLDLSGSQQITDAGLASLRRLPHLQHLNLSWCRGISDAGAAHLSACAHLEYVSLQNTPTGDGAVRALGGKPRLSHFKAGDQIGDAGLELLEAFPVFQNWRGGEVEMSLLSPHARPNFLWLNLRAPFTNAGLVHLSRLEGLFAVSLVGNPGGPYENFASAVTAAGLLPLAGLPHLGWLGCTGRLCDDEAMRLIGDMPHLRMLMGQGTVATDAGFAALSRSATLEYIWGRECPNLTGRGFASLSRMPALRGLAVSCKNVDDEALALLPLFPALRALMPMDVSDAGFRHVGRCERLQELWCMYCRDTTDRATEQIAGLSRLTTYYAGQTRITDRSLEILSRMPSLEVLHFWKCEGITEAGVALLRRLPRLRELHLEGVPQ